MLSYGAGTIQPNLKSGPNGEYELPVYNSAALTLSGDISAVPETSTSLGLLALGAGGLLTRRRFILKA